MDRDQETKKISQFDESSQIKQHSFYDVKFEDSTSFWSQNLREKTTTVYLQDIFKFPYVPSAQQDQIFLRIKQELKPQLEQFLKQNRKNVKLMKYPKLQWNYKKNISNHYDDKIYQISQQTVHQYSSYMKIDRNIKRLETQDLNFKYNFTTEMREKFKLDILQTQKAIWRTQSGIDYMVLLNQLYALNHMDIIQLYSLYLFLVETTDIARLDMDQLKNFLSYQIQKKNIYLAINLDSLSQIFLKLSTKEFCRLKPNVFQLNIHQIQQFNLQQIQSLSHKSFKTHQYINRSTAYICNSCSRYDSQCVCEFENKLASLRSFLDFCQACKVKYSKKILWNIEIIRAAQQSICGDNCYKHPNNRNQAIKNLQQFELIEEDYPLIIDRDPCSLAKQYKTDCLTIFIQARFKYKEIRLYYLEELKKLQQLADQNILINHPYDNGLLYIPCCHQQDFTCENCQCQLFCSKYCDCPYNQCEKKFQGCNCKDRCSADSRCSCRRDSMECDPLLCKCCSPDSLPICSNMQLLISNFKPTLLGRSSVCPGLGIFAKNYIMKDELIMVYLGEILIDDEDEIRDHFDDTCSFYNYSLTDDRYTIESRFCGNESRFINHNSFEMINCRTKQILSQGKYQLAIYATKNIEPEEEIILNYNEGEKINKATNSWIDLNQRFWNYKQSMAIGKK